jgi:hypothetical protein
VIKHHPGDDVASLEEQRQTQVPDSQNFEEREEEEEK